MIAQLEKAKEVSCFLFFFFLFFFQVQSETSFVDLDEQSTYLQHELLFVFLSARGLITFPARRYFLLSLSFPFIRSFPLIVSTYELVPSPSLKTNPFLFREKASWRAECKG
jgi:hypothetical protein